MREVAALVHFPPGLLPLIASFLEGQSIIVAGGITNAGRIISTTLCYSPDARNWRTDVPSMSTQRVSSAAVAIGDRMLIFGGRSRFHFSLATCEAFDLATQEWSALPPMSTPRSFASAAAWHGRAFAIGGWNSSGSLSSAECFDSAQNQWSHIPAMSTGRYHAAAVAVPDRGLIVMGGLLVTSGHDPCAATVLQSAELYDPATNAWTPMTWQLPRPLCDFAAHCIDQVIYILGGCTAGGGSDACWSIDLRIAAPTWSPLPSMPTTITGLASTVLL